MNLVYGKRLTVDGKRIQNKIEKNAKCFFFLNRTPYTVYRMP